MPKQLRNHRDVSLPYPLAWPANFMRNKSNYSNANTNIDLPGGPRTKLCTATTSPATIPLPPFVRPRQAIPQSFKFIPAGIPRFRRDIMNKQDC
ncbi:hypothetical protein SODALDRAFT_355822 [Sodiomyces alkalinus F11]|uniref:Uncharacterized protein n=1 Tax=Sodiomyces alkalinus (strain CBS 110278 / VKM F-3762 / F11) TaxID=1314773 RepID=A0A3N2QA30_SODAK|nr:hypothetical protein SODALDRAFT_355822 [Sodiomyces alkalinus F11]ROT43602.1 hypothetical protein SODALDRAFT_355822 [Sodiomyces alkalinus F11]